MLNTKKINRNRMYQEVVSQIEEAIVQGTLRPGDQLPPELELGRQLGASRGTVREALRVLEERGLIEVRPGAAGGAFVRHTGVSKLTDTLGLLLQLRKVSFDDLAEFRAVVEAETAALAARRRTPDQVEALRELAGRAARLLAENPADDEGMVRADIELHVALAEMADNPVFAAVTRMVHQTVLGGLERFAVRGPERLAGNLADMEALVEAVAEGDGQRAAGLARRHVETFNRHMKTRHQPAGQGE